MPTNLKLRTEKLVKFYRKNRVVNEVSIEVKSGEVVGLLGPNGAGKTTIFYMIIGNISPNEGKIFLDGKDITELPMYKRARLGIGYLCQEASIFRGLTVRENILAILEVLPYTKEERNRKFEEVIHELNLTHLLSQKAYTLSGGERRRVEIARTLVLSPKFLLLDEPFLGVDPLTIEELQKIIKTLAKKMNIGILITDHSVRDTLEITDRAYIIYKGEILTEGSSKELLSDELAKKFYLGERF